MYPTLTTEYTIDEDVIPPFFRGWLVIPPPFLMGSSRRIHAAVFSFMADVMPPMPMLGVRCCKSRASQLPGLVPPRWFQKYIAPATRHTPFGCSVRYGRFVVACRENFTFEHHKI